MHPPSKSAGQSHLHPWHQRREPPQDSRSNSTRRASRSSRSGSDRSCGTPVGASVLIPTPPNRPPPSRPAVRRTPSPSTMSLDPSKNQGGGRPPQSQSPQRLPSVSRHRSRSPAARRRHRARNSSESPPRRTRARAQTPHETPVGAAPRQHQEAPVIQVLREQLQQEETPMPASASPSPAGNRAAANPNDARSQCDHARCVFQRPVHLTHVEPTSAAPAVTDRARTRVVGASQSSALTLIEDIEMINDAFSSSPSPTSKSPLPSPLCMARVTRAWLHRSHRPLAAKVTKAAQPDSVVGFCIIVSIIKQKPGRWKAPNVFPSLKTSLAASPTPWMPSCIPFGFPARTRVVEGPQHLPLIPQAGPDREQTPCA